MAAPELYAPRRPDAVRAQPGPRLPADPARSRGLIYRALTSGLALAVVGGFSYYAWTAYSGDRLPDAAAEIATIHASVDPLKTPPENPGGIAAPGSEYEFFASVNGGRLDVRPDEEFVLPPPEAPITEPTPEIFDRPPPVPMELATGPFDDVSDEAGDAEAEPLAPIAIAGVSVPPVLAAPMLPLPVVEQGQLDAQPVALDSGSSTVAANTPRSQTAIDTLVASMASESAGAPVPQDPVYTVAAAPAAVAEQGQSSGATVQLASMLSREQAEQEWLRLNRLLPDLLAGREPIIRTSTSNDRTYYRVIISASAGEAAALCAEIKNRSLDCIVRN